MSESPEDWSFFLWRRRLEQKLRSELLDITSLPYEFRAFTRLYELPKQMNRSFTDFVFLRLDLNLENYLLEEGLQAFSTWACKAALGSIVLVLFFTQRTVVLSKLEMDAVSDDFEPIDAILAVKASHLSLLSKISLDPLRLDSLFALVIYVLTT